VQNRIAAVAIFTVCDAASLLGGLQLRNMSLPSDAMYRYSCANVLSHQSRISLNNFHV